ncbi:uncharacterized protein LOC127702877 [Mytilus californianus]|uniref:uncharacterized protein LOC127702877 n=1 Tax=Mytilus californianus TaxID=6549 RepID=UPI0022469838|nr:uncharacterized protein LOC127702877 [Mytilus californianus]
MQTTQLQTTYPGPIITTTTDHTDVSTTEVIQMSSYKAQIVTLTVDKALPVDEGDRLEFTCSLTGYPKVVQYIKTQDTGPIVYWITIGGRCDQILYNKTLYNATCDKYYSRFYLEIRNVPRTFNQHNITCEAQYDVTTGETQSVTQSITLEVKPKNTDETSTERPLSHNECLVTGRNILIGFVVVLVLTQIMECVIGFILFRKGRIVFTKQRSYEDVRRNNIEGQTYNTTNKGTKEPNLEQIYDDVKY